MPHQKVKPMLHEYWFLDVYILLVAAVVGGCIASFLTCMAARHGQEGALTKRSHCDSCGHELGARDLVPVFSWLFLKGSCRYCGAKIPPTCVYSEIALGILFMVATWIWDVSIDLAIVLIVISLGYYTIARRTNDTSDSKGDIHGEHKTQKCDR